MKNSMVITAALFALAISFRVVGLQAPPIPPPPEPTPEPVAPPEPLKLEFELPQYTPQEMEDQRALMTMLGGVVWPFIPDWRTPESDVAGTPRKSAKQIAAERALAEAQRKAAEAKRLAAEAERERLRKLREEHVKKYGGPVRPNSLRPLKGKQTGKKR